MICNQQLKIDENKTKLLIDMITSVKHDYYLLKLKMVSQRRQYFHIWFTKSNWDLSLYNNILNLQLLQWTINGWVLSSLVDLSPLTTNFCSSMWVWTRIDHNISLTLSNYKNTLLIYLFLHFFICLLVCVSSTPRPDHFVPFVLF